LRFEDKVEMGRLCVILNFKVIRNDGLSVAKRRSRIIELLFIGRALNYFSTEALFTLFHFQAHSAFLWVVK
jgi:hypothetical protein